MSSKNSRKMQEEWEAHLSHILPQGFVNFKYFLKFDMVLIPGANALRNSIVHAYTRFRAEQRPQRAAARAPQLTFVLASKGAPRSSTSSTTCSCPLLAAQ